jgi:prepilin-type N-terminal cleavage/methylation domain-containing protein
MRRRSPGFTLVEMIGVLAIMAIVASFTVPNIIRQMQTAKAAGEDAKLDDIAQSIMEGIKDTGKIPNPNITPYDPDSARAGGWADIAYRFTTLTDDTAPGGGFSPGTLHYVFPTEPDNPTEPDKGYVGTARRVYLDPALLNYLSSLFGAAYMNTVSFATPPAGWPAVTAGGVAFPNQAIKMYIVSSSRPDYLLNCSPNSPNVQVAANNYGNAVAAPLIDQLASWIKAVDPVTGFILAPGTAVENWLDSGHQFLHVKIVDLRPLFCRVNLREFPYPQTATTQTESPGGGYTTGTTYSANIGAFSFSFIAPAAIAPATTATFNNPGPPVTGTPESSIALNGTRSQITRDGATRTTMTGTIPAPAPPAGAEGAAAANFNITINNPPWWDISPPISVSGQQMPNNANTQSFYVIKGTSLSLYADAATFPFPAPSPILTVQVNADCTFEYFNSSWTRVD